MMTDAGTEELDAAAGTWLMSVAGLAGPTAAIAAAAGEDCPPALTQVRPDGKAVRGARNPDGTQVRLLAALVGPDAASSVVAAEAAVGAKTNEVPVAAVVVLGQIDLHGTVVTADALHTVKAIARLQPSCWRGVLRVGARAGPAPAAAPAVPAVFAG